MGEYIQIVDQQGYLLEDTVRQAIKDNIKINENTHTHTVS